MAFLGAPQAIFCEMRSKNDRFPLVKKWGEEEKSTVNCILQRVLLSCDAPASSCSLVSPLCAGLCLLKLPSW